ncbi:hypothetical protein [Telmatospirillum sp.]|uniref:hypothetical protein n=1 Tax=Telmatospirillum sp. TaxID=2079197 RepID=UPI0028455C62|nr:hypothetical protein [Telmatospirillum sp.]MDR3439890.1 hypothetical protein [Telmatospirillum sp.]
MSKFLAVLIAAVALSGCAGTSLTEAATALKDDKASVCVVVHNAFPPFANDFTLVRIGEGSTTAPACK